MPSGAGRTLFFQQFLRNFQTTGAVAPSGRSLARALCRYVGSGPAATANDPSPPQRILEVGPGTGAITAELVTRLRPGDTLDLVELNDAFVAHLKHRFQQEPAFQRVTQQVQIFHQPVQGLPQVPTYDRIVSGLPLNNFSVELVQDILASVQGLLLPTGVLSFFEYIAVRTFRGCVSGRATRERLRGIGRAMDSVLRGQEIHRDAVWWNFPPAWAHHVQYSSPPQEKNTAGLGAARG